MKIIRPTLIIDKKKAVRNIERMMRKITQSAKSAGPIRFRPHFKTHQSARVGEWFRDLEVTSITVSSVEMASYFAGHGWQDITIAILVNPREIEAIDALAGTVALDLLVDSAESAKFIDRKLNHIVNIWIKIDTGYHRTGLEWNQNNEILAAAQTIKELPKLHFRGLLTHSGHSYKAKSTAELKEIYNDTVTKMNGIRDYLKEKGIAGVEISIGDTPTCSAVDTFYGIDEVRCGNFVFYDVMQLTPGSCGEEDIAAAVACPVIARYPQRNEIVIYGGAVHLSKESITDKNNHKIFGLAALPFPDQDSLTWGPTLKHTYLSNLSQEHGIIKTTAECCRQVQVGDILMILPVHSCLTANLMKKNQYINQGGFFENPTAWGGICRARPLYDASRDGSPPWTFFFAAPQVPLDSLKNFLIKNLNKSFLPRFFTKKRAAGGNDFISTLRFWRRRFFSWLRRGRRVHLSMNR